MPHGLRVGGMPRERLVATLRHEGIRTNRAADRLLASDLFTTSTASRPVRVTCRRVGELGLATGATYEAICARAVRSGLGIAPAELGPYLRLAWRHQSEGAWGQPRTRHRAPPGSLTIASAPLASDEAFPRGFYLRRIRGALWLRGYVVPDDHGWDSDDRFAFLE